MHYPYICFQEDGDVAMSHLQKRIDILNPPPLNRGKKKNGGVDKNVRYSVQHIIVESFQQLFIALWVVPNWLWSSQCLLCLALLFYLYTISYISSTGGLHWHGSIINWHAYQSGSVCVGGGYELSLYLLEE